MSATVRPLAWWRVRVWRQPEGMWAARYVRHGFAATNEWRVSGLDSRDEALNELTEWVRYSPNAIGADR